MSSDAIEPTLTKGDLKCLAAVPSSLASVSVSVWQVGEALDEVNLTDVLLTLNGLLRFGYMASGDPRKRGVRWVRTAKGDEAVLRGR